jgi:hypothetical protein
MSKTQMINGKTLSISPDTWLQIYTPGTFHQLHLQVFNIIECITQQDTFRGHPFTQEWIKLKKSMSKYPLTAELSWRTRKLALNIKEIHQYKDFAVKCPTIEKHIYLKGKSKTTMEFGIIQYGEEALKMQAVDQPQDTANPAEPKETVSNIKNMDSKHLRNILSVVLPYLENYSKMYDDDYADLCKEWLAQGLQATTSPADLQSICDIESINDLYMLLRVSPALPESVIVSKTDHHGVGQNPDTTRPTRYATCPYSNGVEGPTSTCISDDDTMG